MNKTKTKTTYGVYNMIEWHALLRMGKATVKVPFTGGSITTQGVTPATFTTEDPIVQFAIESSPQFKNGKIKAIQRVALKSTIDIEANEKSSERVPAQQAKEDTDTDTSTKECITESLSCKESEKIEPEGTTERVPEVVEFTCNDDAKDYLEQKFGCKRSKLYTRADIIATGKANGVEINFV